MADDIVPGLLEKIQKEFDSKVENSSKIKLLKKAKKNYKDANEYAIEIGQILADILTSNITEDILPDGKIYFNIADRILRERLKKNYDLISSYSSEIQLLLNKEANIGLKVQIPPLNKNRVKGLVEAVLSDGLDNFGEPVITFSQNIVDDFIETNANFHAKAGLNPKLTRTVHGKACEWCKNLAGTYDYPVPDNIYERHKRCRCIVEYNPKDGRGIQNSHSKKWRESQKDDRIDARKTIGISVTSGAKNYIRYTGDDSLYSAKELRQIEHAYTQYDAIKNGNQSLEKHKIFSNIGRFREMKDFSKDDVDIAFNHVFNDLHELHDGKGLFTPEYDMAQSWNRLINGNQIEQHDLILLRHERLEHDYMYKENLDYNTAHRKTSAYFNYADAVRKYKEGK